MDSSGRDKIAMLSAPYFQSDDSTNSTSRGFSTGNTSVSMFNPTSSQEYSSDPLRNERQTSFVQMNGPLYVNRNRDFVFQPPQGALEQTITDPTPERYPSLDRFHTVSYGDAKGWAKRMCSFLLPYIPGVISPHKKVVQLWNRFFVISCLFAAFLDPLFFFLLYVHQNNKCIVISKPMMITILILRSTTDFIYLMHILLQFRLAYENPESRDVDAEDLIYDPRKIARKYFLGYFGFDFLIVLPLPQIIILLVLPRSLGIYRSSYAYTLLRVAILVQYVPRLCRFLPMLVGSSPTGFIFKSAWANFVINLLTFVLASHVVGSLWYLFGLQRVNRCFRNACNDSNINVSRCSNLIDCGHGNENDYRRFENDSTWDLWKTNEYATACFWKDGNFNFGIYEDAVNLTTRSSVVTRYVYSWFWGLQQISTLAGNQAPSYFEWEVLFTMAIIGIGLLLFALLIGNMQNFLQSLGRRKFEMLLRQHDVERWMRRHCLPDELRRQVRDAERFNWAATRGVNEGMLMENLPEDLQREIRRHLFKFVRKVKKFQQLDEPIIDAICERLSTKTYIKGSKVLSMGGPIDKMVFIIKGKMESVGEDLSAIPLSKGDVCGEELLTWCLEHFSVNKDERKIRIVVPKLLSNRQVRCSSNVEAFVLQAADLEEVANLFARFLRSPRVQEATRNESQYNRRGLAARRFQVAWRYGKK
ncbi:hypothetical protein BUALT_Bualt02G0132800 [Buddleja alternifolia]|uniref:Cyclic nucleotide-binding domain-containing protein n=1 Tax=Buddleja alternifolia TaxID=168488 RepID=A0AAV6Y7V0_9LAMI|nr:hypothetical protein BUALT_Bualt02G0132800 [Buddleja alternifolia]